MVLIPRSAQRPLRRFLQLDEDTMTVTGYTTGNEYRLGDEVRVRVKEVSVEKRQIDLVMLS